MKANDKSAVVKLETDILLLFYNFSDQHGVVDIPGAVKWAKAQLGVILPRTPFTLNQEHINVLMDRGAIPDIRSILLKASNIRQSHPNLPK